MATIRLATLGAMGGIGEFGEAISNAVNEANVWAGGTGRPFAFWVPIQGDGTIKGGLAYDNGHPSCLAGEVYGLKFAQLIKRELGLDVELPDDVSERVVRQMLGADLNVALFGTAFTSEGFSFGWNTKVENINDGKRNSGCQSSKRNTDPYDYVGVALAAPASVTNMVLYWENATYCGSYASDGYRLFYQAEKNGEWIRLADTITVTRSGAVDTVTLTSPTTMHAVKVELRNGDANQFYPPKLFELEIYAETDGGAETGSLFQSLTGTSVAESYAEVDRIIALARADMAAIGSGYVAWAAANGLGRAVEKTAGLENLFRYVFDKAAGSLSCPLVSISLSEGEKVVVTTPEPVNLSGVSLRVLASTSLLDWSKATEYEVTFDNDGRIVIEKDPSSDRMFFRLAAE